MINPLTTHQDAVLEKVAERLRLAFSMRGYSKLQFVEKINREEPMVRKWLSGKTNFRGDTRTELALALEVPLSFFFTDGPVPTVSGQHQTEGKVRHDPPSVLYPAFLIPVAKSGNLLPNQARGSMRRIHERKLFYQEGGLKERSAGAS